MIAFASWKRRGMSHDAGGAHAIKESWHQPSLVHESFQSLLRAKLRQPREGTMKLPRRQFLHLAAGAAALPFAPRIARAQAYPTRPIRLILPYGPGNAPDIVARLIGQWLSERLSQQFIIDNRPGAGTNIGTEAAVRAAPDGYTLLYATTANAISASV